MCGLAAPGHGFLEFEGKYTLRPRPDGSGTYLSYSVELVPCPIFPLPMVGAPVTILPQRSDGESEGCNVDPRQEMIGDQERRHPYYLVYRHEARNGERVLNPKEARRAPRFGQTDTGGGGS